MRVYYVVVDFGRKVRQPGSGPLGGERLDTKHGVTLYRDTDLDPHTLVAEGKGVVYHYPWATVRMSVVDAQRQDERDAGKTRKAG